MPNSLTMPSPSQVRTASEKNAPTGSLHNAPPLSSVEPWSTAPSATAPDGSDKVGRDNILAALAAAAPPLLSSSNNKVKNKDTNKSSGSWLLDDISNWITGGKATLYSQNGTPGSCGKVNSDDAFIVAMHSRKMNKSMCGKKVVIKNKSSGARYTGSRSL
ncbi:unnamed protein product [Sympodiomycopsis kandeliae]